MRIEQFHTSGSNDHQPILLDEDSVDSSSIQIEQDNFGPAACANWATASVSRV
jgi:hypothetical protein